jgi:N-acetylneuraminic acid mutarotase
MLKRRVFLQASTCALSMLAMSTKVSASETTRGNWQRLADLPYPVQEIYPALRGDNIHVAGGFSAQDSAVVATDRHIQYSIASDRWRELAALPAVRHHPYLVTCEDVIYALGGYQPGAAGDWIMQGQAWRYDSAQDRWEVAADAPELHAETVCLALGLDIHVIGGRAPNGQGNANWQDHGDSARHLVFDTASGKWHRAAPALTARNSAAGAVIAGDLYVVGGRTVTGGNVAVLEVYDAREDRWRTATPMPQAQGGLAAAAINGELVAFGGEYFGPKTHGVHGNVWRYAPRSDRWVALAPMPTPRHGLGAASDGKRVFAIGGATGVATTGTSAIFEALSFNGTADLGSS